MDFEHTLKRSLWSICFRLLAMNLEDLAADVLRGTHGWTST